MRRRDQAQAAPEMIPAEWTESESIHAGDCYEPRRDFIGGPRLMFQR